MSDLTKLTVESLVGPIVFIVACVFLFSIVGMIVYYTLLRKIIPEKLSVVLWFLGSAAIVYMCTENYEWVKVFVKQFI